MVSELELKEAIQTEKSKWIEPDVVNDKCDFSSGIERANDLKVPDIVSSSSSINNGWCLVFAERVYARLRYPKEVSIESDGNNHTWLELNGLCYDAECIEGVEHPSLLPIYNR